MKKQEAIELVELLKKEYPDAKCSLDFTTPFELVVAVMMSAQCTDERVNIVTPTLFKRCPTIKDYAEIDLKELESIIHSCGFYKNKAKNIKQCANQILEKFNGEVPHTMEELTQLAGIGRKSANVVLLNVFGIATGVAVDTHAKRISNLTGLSKNTTPEKIEQDLIKKFPKEYLKDLNHLFVYHGRKICVARNPKCDICPIKHICKTGKKLTKDQNNKQ